MGQDGILVLFCVPAQMRLLVDTGYYELQAPLEGWLVHTKGSNSYVPFCQPLAYSPHFSHVPLTLV